MKGLYIILFLSISSFNSVVLAEQSIDEFAIEKLIEAHCASNTEFHSQCYSLNESQCRDIFANLVTVCSQNPGGYPIPPNDPTAATAFTNCIVNEMESYLVGQGFDLDKTCAENNIKPEAKSTESLQQPISETTSKAKISTVVKPMQKAIVEEKVNPPIQPTTKPAVKQKENPLIKERRMLFPTGKQREFVNQEDIEEAKAWLDIFSGKKLGIVIGKFDPATKSEIVGIARYTGGGYILMDFHISKIIKLKKELPSVIRVRYPIAIINIQDEQYQKSNLDERNVKFKELIAHDAKYKNGEISDKENKKFKDDWSKSMNKLEAIKGYVRRMNKGKFSLTDDEFVLFLKYHGSDKEYSFTYNGIWLLKVGTFVDVLLIDN